MKKFKLSIYITHWQQSLQLMKPKTNPINKKFNFKKEKKRRGVEDATGI